jgi:hypothetical protein
MKLSRRMLLLSSVQIIPDVILLEDHLRELVVSTNLAVNHVNFVGDESEVEFVELLEQSQQPFEPNQKIL